MHKGDFEAVVPLLEPGYDLAFFDGYEPPAGLLTALGTHLAPDGALVTTNLDLGAGRFRTILASAREWNTPLVGDIAVSARA